MGSVNNTIGSVEFPANANEEPRREYFSFYRSYYNCIVNLSEKQQLSLCMAVLEYCLNFQEPDFSNSEAPGVLQAVWAALLPNMKRSNNNYLRSLEPNSGAPKGNTNAKKGNKPETSRKQAGNKQVRNKYEEISSMKKEGKNDGIRETAGPDSLSFPYSSQRFMTTWDELRKQPKWKKKTTNALQLSLNKLGKYDEVFAILLMEDAIEAGWQRVVFDDTDAKYNAWMQSQQGKNTLNQHQQPPADGGGWHGEYFKQESL